MINNLFIFVRVFFPTLVSTIVYWMCGLAPYFERYIIFVIVIVLLSMTATSLFVLCGAFAPNPQLAAILGFSFFKL